MTGSTGPSATAPPPRNGLAMREPTPPKPAYEAPPAGEPSPRVEPAFADSRRSLTAVSWASNLRGLVSGDSWVECRGRGERQVPVVCSCEFLL